MAEVASNIIHNIGNIGTSLKVQAQMIKESYSDDISHQPNKLGQLFSPEHSTESLIEKREAIAQYMGMLAKSAAADKKDNNERIVKLLGYVRD